MSQIRIITTRAEKNSTPISFQWLCSAHTTMTRKLPDSSGWITQILDWLGMLQTKKHVAWHQNKITKKVILMQSQIIEHTILKGT